MASEFACLQPIVIILDAMIVVFEITLHWFMDQFLEAEEFVWKIIPERPEMVNLNSTTVGYSSFHCLQAAKIHLAIDFWRRDILAF